MKRTVVLGGLLTAAVTALLVLGFGRMALLQGLIFGLLATAIQVGAGEAMRGAAQLPYSGFLKRYGIGMGLRLAGVAILMAAIVLRREFFDPLSTAIGFLGVLIPLLFLEARLAR